MVASPRSRPASSPGVTTTILPPEAHDHGWFGPKPRPAARARRRGGRIGERGCPCRIDQRGQSAQLRLHRLRSCQRPRRAGAWLSASGTRWPSSPGIAKRTRRANSMPENKTSSAMVMWVGRQPRAVGQALVKQLQRALAHGAVRGRHFWGPASPAPRGPDGRGARRPSAASRTASPARRIHISMTAVFFRGRARRDCLRDRPLRDSGRWRPTR